VQFPYDEGPACGTRPDLDKPRLFQGLD